MKSLTLRVAALSVVAMVTISAAQAETAVMNKPVAVSRTAAPMAQNQMMMQKPVTMQANAASKTEAPCSEAMKKSAVSAAPVRMEAKAPMTAAPAVVAAPEEVTIQEGSLVDVAQKSGQFNTLSAALKAAGLQETLQGAGPFTLFAPTDAAFAALPAGTVENLLKPENKDQLIKILTYHVVPGNVKAAEVSKLKEANTVEGEAVKISTNRGMYFRKNVMINDAMVTKSDINANNGTIHIINKVLMPAS